MKYSDFIKVNENFQYSVNLQFDINNISKIKEYIPTKDGCEILKYYFNSVLNGKNRASTLIGPYGKGKSHLLLVFMTLMNNYNEDDSKEINNFISKVSKIDEELSDLIITIRNDKQKLMPVIINSNYDDINQAFLLGISEALEREKISDIILNTYFDIALDVITTWEKDYKEVLSDLDKCLDNSNCSLKDLKSGLKKYSKDTYEIFKEVYRCISRGQEFKPLVNTDIVKTYKDISYEISKLGYSGIFIAFDEFSKFLESSNESTIMRDLKILQDFAELAVRTGKNEQIHLSCITHKAMNEYLKTFDENKANSFKTVEGRFKNIYFNSSMEQNYEIVSHALKKDKNFNEFFEEYFLKKSKFFEKISDLDVFKNINNIDKILFKGCFPLNPLTTYSLIELSEKIAQNERTLFTFLTDDDVNGLKYFIENNGSNIFNVDKIYDYFSSLLKKENDDVIKNIWLKSENALRKNISDNSRSIIKTIAVIYMINNLEEFTTTDDIVQLSVNLSDLEYKKCIDELIEKSILRRKKITDELDFATMFNRKLTKDIKDLVDNKYELIDEKKVINDIVGVWYSIPRRYNENYKLTRFFSNIFMTEEELLNLNNFSLLYENNYCDGIIINLIKTSKDLSDLKEHFLNIKDDRTVLKISKLSFSKNFTNLLKEYEAIKYLKQQNMEAEELYDELDMMAEETLDAIKEAIKEYIADDNISSCLYYDKEYKRVKYISSLISDICSNVYNMTPVINNELINKRDLSAPIKKARNIVIDCVLNNNNSEIKSPTSAEATIYKAIVEKTNIKSVKNILDIIKEYIHNADNKKIDFENLYSILENKPYAIRKGIIPVLLSMALTEYSDNIIMYYMNREIELNSETLVKINDNPDKYYMIIEKGTTEKLDYINNLLDLYQVNNIDASIRINVQNVVQEMKKWILGLPRLIRELSITTDLSIKKEYIKIKSELLRPDINNNEFLFTYVPNLFDNNLEVTFKEISEMKEEFDRYLSIYSDDLIDETKNILNKKYKGSLGTLLKELYETKEENLKNKIFDLKTKSFIEYISDINTYDDKKIINKLAKIITGFYIEDWQQNEKKNYIEELMNVNNSINTKDDMNIVQNKLVLVSGNTTIEKNINSSIEISALGNTMKNNIEEIMDEYGGSLSEQEKINVLLDIMRKYM